MGVVWVHWLMARGQIVKDSLFLMYTPYSRLTGSLFAACTAVCTGLSFRGGSGVRRSVCTFRVRGAGSTSGVFSCEL